MLDSDHSSHLVDARELFQSYFDGEDSPSNRLSNKKLNFSGVTDILDKTLVNLETYYQAKDQQATETQEADKENIQELLEEIQGKFSSL